MEWLGGGDVRVAPSRSRHSMKSRAPLGEMRSVASVSPNELRIDTADRFKAQRWALFSAVSNPVELSRAIWGLDQVLHLQRPKKKHSKPPDEFIVHEEVR